MGFDPNQKSTKENGTEKSCEISLKKIHDSVPAHLFERSTTKSMLYLLHDAVLITITFLVTRYAIASLPNYLYWPIIVCYWLLQGTIFTGVWILGHECGHQAFSPSQKVNDAVGLVLHSFLLTPYHAWKISHAQHHRCTGHMSKDMAFVPPTRKSYLAKHRSFTSFIKHGLYVTIGYGKGADPVDDEQAVTIDKQTTATADRSDSQENDNHSFLDELLSEIPLLQVIGLVSMVFLGWPSYLLFNLGGQIHGKWTSHFTHKSPLFTDNHRQEIFISNVGLAVMFSILGAAIYQFNLTNVLIFYFVPYLMVNMWLVVITFLHHTDPVVPHYREGSWTYVKGALATVDRDYGFLINHLHHHISDTHVAHHLFSRVPFYNAKAVTKAIKPLLGQHYNYDNTFFLKALWINFLSCHYVADEGEVIYYESPINKKIA